MTDEVPNIRSTKRSRPDLVRIETVCREEDEDYEGAIGFHIDTDIDWNGHGVYTVHLPAPNVDVRARSIEVISRAQEKVNG